MAASTRASRGPRPGRGNRLAQQARLNRRVRVTRHGVENRPPQPVRVRVAELEVGQFLVVALQEPGVIDHRQQDQGLPRPAGPIGSRGRSSWY